MTVQEKLLSLEKRHRTARAAVLAVGDEVRDARFRLQEGHDWMKSLDHYRVKQAIGLESQAQRTGGTIEFWAAELAHEYRETEVSITEAQTTFEQLTKEYEVAAATSHSASRVLDSAREYLESRTQTAA